MADFGLRSIPAYASRAKLPRRDTPDDLYRCGECNCCRRNDLHIADDDHAASAHCRKLVDYFGPANALGLFDAEPVL